MTILFSAMAATALGLAIYAAVRMVREYLHHAEEMRRRCADRDRMEIDAIRRRYWTSPPEPEEEFEYLWKVLGVILRVNPELIRPDDNIYDMYDVPSEWFWYDLECDIDEFADEYLEPHLYEGLTPVDLETPRQFIDHMIGGGSGVYLRDGRMLLYDREIRRLERRHGLAAGASPARSGQRQCRSGGD